MITRINSTGRRKLTSKEVAITVHAAERDGEPRTFDAQLDLAAFADVPSAAVVLEALWAGSSTVLRFPWGTVAAPLPPDDRRLAGLFGKRVKFHAKVIDQSETIGRLLGYGQYLEPTGTDESEAERNSLLPVELSEEIGHEPWRLDFDRPDSVYLLINSRAPGLRDHLDFTSAMQSLVLAPAVRSILQVSLSHRPDETPAGHWSRSWTKLGTGWHPERLDPGTLPEEEHREWVDAAVDGFCRQRDLLESLGNLDLDPN